MVRQRAPVGDDEPVELHGLAGMEGQLAGSQVQSGGPHAESSLDTVLFQLLGVGQRSPLGLPISCQHLLGQGRSVIGQVILSAYERDAAVEAFTTQGLACVQPAREAPTMVTARGAWVMCSRLPRLAQSSAIEMACLGQRCTHSSTLARSASPGVSFRM